MVKYRSDNDIDWERNFRKFVRDYEQEIHYALKTKKGIELYCKVYNKNTENIDFSYWNSNFDELKKSDSEFEKTIQNIINSYRYKKFNITTESNINLKDLYFFSNLLNVSIDEILQYNSNEKKHDSSIFYNDFYFYVSPEKIQDLKYLIKEFPKSEQKEKSFCIIPIALYVPTCSLMFLTFNSASTKKDIKYIMAYYHYDDIRSYLDYVYGNAKSFNYSYLKDLGSNYTKAYNLFKSLSQRQYTTYKKGMRKSFEFIHEDEQILKLINSSEFLRKTILKSRKEK